MNRSIPKIQLVISAIIACSFALVSCGNKDKDGDGEDKNTSTVKGKGGVEVKSGQSVKLPDDWPDDIPIADGITIKMSQKMPPLGQNLIANSSQEGPELMTYYKKEMPAEGWEEANATELPNGGLLSFAKGERRVNIVIASSPDKPTSVTFQLVTQKPRQ